MTVVFAKQQVPGFYRVKREHRFNESKLNHTPGLLIETLKNLCGLKNSFSFVSINC